MLASFTYKVVQGAGSSWEMVFHCQMMMQFSKGVTGLSGGWVDGKARAGERQSDRHRTFHQAPLSLKFPATHPL